MSQPKRQCKHVLLPSDYDTSDDENQVGITQQTNTIQDDNTIVENASTHGSSSSTSTPSSIRQTQSSLDQYFPPSNNSFQQINSLTENTFEFIIRGLVTYRSSVRVFGDINKIFDATICDASGEIKLVAFNEEADRLHSNFILNKAVVIENGQVKKIKERYENPYHSYEILMLSNTHIRPYEAINFNPIIKIIRKEIRNISQSAHGTYVDVEGEVIMDRGTFTSTSENTRKIFRRRLIRIKDETGTISITIWNAKNDEIPDNIMNRTVKIRKGRVNLYNDYVSINVSDQSIIQLD